METRVEIEREKRYTMSYSRTIMAFVALPGHANPAGNVHGGEMMKLMDNTAFVVAQKHALRNVVTVAVDELNFHNPAYLGNLITCHGELVYTSKSSMLVSVRVDVDCLVTGRRTCALSGLFVMVALDKEGKSATIEQLVLESDEERSKFEEGRKQYESIKSRSGKCYVTYS